MYAVEFETDIQGGIIRIPEEYRRLQNKHAKVVILVKENTDDVELQAMSNHSAGTVEEWRDPLEDEVWN
jgi:hypothetical protein